LSTRFEFNSSKREFVRLNTDVPVRYKFLSKDIDLEVDKIFEGTTNCLSGGGLLLHGKIPSFNWIPAMLMNKIQLGVNLLLPSCGDPVKALCAVSWLEEFQDGNDRAVIGLRFMDIEKEHQDAILKYLIRAQMTK